MKIIPFKEEEEEKNKHLASDDSLHFASKLPTHFAELQVSQE